jgi:hypothetical protein
MNRKAAWIAATVLLMLTAVLVGPSVSAPEPSQAAIEWELEFEHAAPKPILVKVPGKVEPELYWFMPYKVINRTGEDRFFVPDIVLYTSTGQILRSNQDVNLAVYEYIKQTLNEPLLRDNAAMTGKLLQGADNAKTGVAIFKDFDPEAAAFDVFVGGLSGEYATVELPTPIEVTQVDLDGEQNVVTKSRIVLSKTLKLSYGLRTEARARMSAKPELNEKVWVMR